jgi:hypothetical protein
MANYPAQNFYESQYNEYMQQIYPQPAAEAEPVVEEAPKEEVKNSPDTKDTEVPKKEEENEANGLDFDEME